MFIVQCLGLSTYGDFDSTYNCCPAMSWLLSLIAWSLLCLVQHFSAFVTLLPQRKRFTNWICQTAVPFPRLILNHVSAIQNAFFSLPYLL